MVTLGYLDEFEQEYKTPADDHLFEYLVKIRDFNFGTTPRKLNINLERRAQHLSQLLGCCINIDSPNRTPFVEFSEGILSLLEGAIATCAVDKLHLKEAYLSIEVIADDEDELEIYHELDDSSGKLHLEVTCSGFDEEAFDLEGQAIVQAWFKELIFELLPEMFMFHDTKSIERMIFEDGALDRSISFGACFNASNNVLGNDLDTKVKDLFAHRPDSKNYPMLRTEAWDKDYPKPELLNSPTNLNKGVGAPPEYLTNPEGIHHQDMSIQGLIKPRLWDKAKWAGVGFSNFPNDIPGLYLLFENTNEGSAVFSDLLDEVGINDKSNRLRVVIVKGISVNDAAHYRVIVSENINSVNKNKLMTMISRINTMTPNSNENLERFLLEYEKTGRCYFGCDAMLRNNERSDTHSGKLGIIINNLSVRWAWEIGENDFDCMAIQKGDEPYIPKHIDTAPVIKLLNPRL